VSLDYKIHYRGLPPSDSIEQRIEEHVAHLERVFGRNPIHSCHIHLELLHHRSGTVAGYRTIIELAVPGKTLVVGRDGGHEPEHQDAYAALAAAFDAMERQLKDHGQKLRQEVKHHEPAALTGRVARIFPQDGFGFLATDDGLEVYFNEQAVLAPGFDRLEIGSRVRFHTEAGDEGPQASTVHIVDIHPPQHQAAQTFV
jgi:cold shock CspA family protein/ribosome-associated translation inhibitor RaiA